MARGMRLEGGRTGARRLRAFVSAMVVVALIGSACGSGSDDTVEVFAAASLTDAFDEIVDVFAEREGVRVRLTLAGSSTLREQLRDGARADVFVSANEQVMEQLLADRGSTTPAVAAAVNELVLAVPAGNPAGIDGLDDLDSDALFIGVCAVGVPCGDLAAAWFDRAGIEPNLDTAESDVRSLVGRLAEGELDAALVYATDVVASDGRIEQVVGAGPTTTYPIVALGPDGQAFVEFVVGREGQAILASWGFGPG